MKKYHKKAEIIDEIALIINRQMYEKGQISYGLYEQTQNRLLKKVR